MNKVVVVFSGKKSPYGSNVIVNGTFDTDSDWIKGTGWTISGGTANSDGSGSFKSLQQDPLPVEIGKTYLVTFDILNYVGGGIRITTIGTNSEWFNGNGSYEYSVVCTSTTIRIQTQLTVGFTGSIDNVVVREIL